MFPNDEVVAYGRANGLGSDYNDIMTAFLRDYYSSNLSLTDLWGRAWAEGYRSINGFTDFPGIANSEFYAPLTHSLILTRGTGNPTFTRATSAWEFDNEGKLVIVPSGAARFGGGRMVRNLLTYTEDFGNAIWDKSFCSNSSNEVNSPIGTMTADKITINTATTQHILATLLSNSFVAGYAYTVSFYIKQSTGRYVQVTLPGAVFGTSQYANIDVSAQSVAYSTGCTCSIIPISDGWMRISYTAVAQSTASSTSPLLIFIDSDSSARAPSFLGNGTDSFYIWGAQLENVTGQAGQTASEYVSTGVLSAPYHGAGEDGVKYFPTNKDGSAISASSLLGYHAEGARTNSLLYSRDLTNAAWVKTNATAAKTATGIDNAPNSASTLTASAADATILQTLTMAAAARSFSAYVKRRTGTGSVYITRDGGTNWTDITSSLGATWTRVKIENTSVLNPSVGFKIATSGDAIDVDCVQDEAGAFISSPIITTAAAVTRNVDALSYTKTGNFSDTAGTLLFSQKLESLGNSGSVFAITIDANKSPAYKGDSGSKVLSADGTSNVGTAPWPTDLSVHKAAGSWTTSPANRSMTRDGLSVLSFASYDGSFNGTDIVFGFNGGTTYLHGYIKNTYIWSTALTDAQLQQVTA